MILASTIERLIAGGDHDRLLDAVLRNGRPIPLQARVRISQPEAIGAAATGLALQRLCELTYAPDARIERCIERICAMQDALEGGFGAVGATAICVAALQKALEFVEGSGIAMSPTTMHRIRASIDRGAHALYEQQASVDGDTPGLIGDEIDTAISLWQLSAMAPSGSLLDLRRARDAMGDSEAGFDHQVDAVIAMGKAPSGGAKIAA